MVHWARDMTGRLGGLEKNLPLQHSGPLLRLQDPAECRKEAAHSAHQAQEPAPAQASPLSSNQLLPRAAPLKLHYVSFPTVLFTGVGRYSLPIPGHQLAATGVIKGERSTPTGRPDLLEEGSSPWQEMYKSCSNTAPV